MKDENNKANFTPTPFTFLELPDYDWEKQYKEDCEFIRNMSIKYGPDEKDYGDFFIPKFIYIPTEMPQYMKERYGNNNTIENKLDRIQTGVNKVLLQSVYNGYLYLINSARDRGDKELEKEYLEKAEDTLLKIKLLDEGKLK